jgi:dCTP diphosphatase
MSEPKLRKSVDPRSTAHYPPTPISGRARHRTPPMCQGVAVTQNVSASDGDLAQLTAAMREFSRERDWEQFHDPKSLLLALVGEVGELTELFQWLPAERAAELAKNGRLHDRAGEEMADVLLYLVRLADVTGVDLASAAQAKLEAGRARFPADVVRSRAPESH